MDYDLLENVAKTGNTFCGDNQHANKLHSQRDTVNVIVGFTGLPVWWSLLS